MLCKRLLCVSRRNRERDREISREGEREREVTTGLSFKEAAAAAAWERLAQDWSRIRIDRSNEWREFKMERGEEYESSLSRLCNKTVI